MEVNKLGHEMGFEQERENILLLLIHLQGKEIASGTLSAWQLVLWPLEHTCWTRSTVEGAGSVVTLHLWRTRRGLQTALIFIYCASGVFRCECPPSITDAPVLGLAGRQQHEKRQS